MSTVLDAGALVLVPMLVPVLVTVLVLGCSALLLTSRATRLHRLHQRVDTSRATLDAALRRRAAVVRSLAAPGVLPPADARLLLRALRAVDAVQGPLHDAEREHAESGLSRAVRTVMIPPRVQDLHAGAGDEALLADLAAAGRRVVLARRFANEAVTSARSLQRTRLVRWAHLAGRAPLPRTFDVDDEPPALSPGRVPGRTGSGASGRGPS